MNIKETSQRKKVLGRGLGALLKDSPILKEKNSLNLIQAINIEQIKVNPLQPRKDFKQATLQELSESIKLHGVIQPLIVRQLNKTNYQLIAGERRLKAAKMAEITTIPVYIRVANDQQMLEIALIENIQRENLNPIEIALSYQRLLTECKLKQEALGKSVGKNRTTVNNYLRLLKLPPAIQVALRDKKISMGHARALINVEAIDTQLTILKKLLDEELSVRKVEALVRSWNSNRRKDPTKKQRDPHLEKIVQNLTDKLSSHLGTKVIIHTSRGKKGAVKIPFVSIEDLNRILEKLAI